MLIGVNWVSPRTLPIIHALIDQGIVDFCEIMVDNVVHLPAEKIRQVLPDVPISLHLVSSRFLEKSLHEMQEMARHLRLWIHDLQPLYVSDHLAQFTTKGGKRLSFIAELEYERDYSHIKDRIITWQELLGTTLLLENFASITSAGKNQAAYYEKLISETNAGLLFDFSNAYIAEHNQIFPAISWGSLIQNTKHFHVAGFRVDQSSQLAIDTHDAPIANEVLDLMRKYFTEFTNLNDKTIVVEFHENVDIEEWKDEILKLKNGMSAC